MSAEQLKVKGNQQYKNQKYQQAIKYYTQAIQLQSSDVYFSNRAAAYIGAKKFQLAIQDCKNAIIINQKNQKAYKRAIFSFMEIGKYDEGLNYCEVYVKKFPFDQQVNNSKMKIKSSKFSNSLKLLKLECLIKCGEVQKALQYSAQESNALSDQVMYYYLRGLALNYNGQTVNGKNFLKSALNRDPDFKLCQIAIKNMKKSENFKNQAGELFKKGQYQEALKKFDECLQIDQFDNSYNSTIYFNIGLTHLKLKETAQAKKDINKAIDLNPNYVKAYIKRGEVNQQLDLHDQAMRDFNKAKQLDPTSFNINSKISDAKVQAKKAKRKDYYALLGVSKDSTQDQIKKGYRKMAIKWHPDKNSQSEQSQKTAQKKFKDIAQGYNILSNPDKRRKYDSGMDIQDIENGGMSGGVDPTQMFNMFFGGGGGGGSFFGGGSPFGGDGGFGQSPFTSFFSAGKPSGGGGSKHFKYSFH